MSFSTPCCFLLLTWGLVILPILRGSDLEVVPLVLQQQLRLWFQDLEDAMEVPVSAEEGDMEEAFALYRRAQKLEDLGKAFARCGLNTSDDLQLMPSEGQGPPHFPLAPAFENVVYRWLDQTALKTRQWADNVSHKQHSAVCADHRLWLWTRCA